MGSRTPLVTVQYHLTRRINRHPLRFEVFVLIFTSYCSTVVLPAPIVGSDFLAINPDGAGGICAHIPKEAGPRTKTYYTISFSSQREAREGRRRSHQLQL